MEIGTRLKNARVEMGLTQERVAEEIGVSRQTVSNWENGRFYPDIVSVIKLSDLYSVSLDELLKEDKNMIRHLKESTDVVESRQKFNRLILKLCYWGLWVLTIAVYWIVGFSDLKFGLINQVPGPYSLLYAFVYDGQLPLCFVIITVIMGFMGAAKDFNKRRWLYVPITGAMFVLYRILTVELVSYVADVYLMREDTGAKQTFNFLKPFIHYFTHDGYSYAYSVNRGEWIIMLLVGLGCSAFGLGVGILIRTFKIVRRKEQSE